MAELIPIANLRGPQGPQGPPGPNGALTAPNNFPTNGNLDTMYGVGSSASYTINSADASKAKGFPEDGLGGLILVWERGANTSGVQEFWPVSSASRGNIFYRRIRVNSSWESWRVYSSQRVDNTAGRAIYTWDDTANREQLIYGDTGERNISDSMVDVAGGTLYIRRNNNFVTLSLIRVVPSVAKPTHVIASMPYGFRSAVGRMERVVNPDNSAVAFIVNQSLTGYQTKTTDNYSVGFVFPTNDPWPSVLPGTAV